MGFADANQTPAARRVSPGSISVGDATCNIEENEPLLQDDVEGVMFDDFVLEQMELEDCNLAVEDVEEDVPVDGDPVKETMEEFDRRFHPNDIDNCPLVWCAQMYPLKKRNIRSITRLFDRLCAAGLVVSTRVKRGRVMYWQIGATDALLTECAAEMGLLMRLKEGTPLHTKYERRHARFSLEEQWQFVSDSNDAPLFTSAERQQVVKFVMVNRAHFDYRALNRQKLVRHLFPTHDLAELRAAEIGCRKSVFKYPIDSIRLYFGEKFALYFAYMDFWTFWLVVPAIAGAGLYSYQSVVGRVDTIPTVIFAIFMYIWGVLYAQFWARRQNRLGVDWDCDDQIEEEFPRDEYLKRSVLKRSSTTHQVEPQYPRAKTKLWFVMFSLPVISTLALSSLACVVTIIALRSATHFVRIGGVSIAEALTGVVHAVLIVMMNYIYAYIAARLTMRETHRTDRIYEDNLIAKMFTLEFVNTFTGVFYTAFAKGKVSLFGKVEPCHGPAGSKLFFPRESEKSCLMDLEIQVFTLFVTLSMAMVFMEMILPTLKVAFNHFCLCVRRKKSNEQVLEESKQPRIDELVPALFWDYNMLIMEFGFVIMFSTAFSLVPIIAFLNCVVKKRADAYGLFRNYQRPTYLKKHTIGTWYSVIELLLTLGLLTNVFIVGFTAKNGFSLMFPNINAYEKLWVIACVEHVLVVFTLATRYLISDRDAATNIVIKRRRYRVGVEEDKQMEKRVELLSRSGVERKLEGLSHERKKHSSTFKKSSFMRKFSKTPDPNAPHTDMSFSIDEEEGEDDFVSARGSIATTEASAPPHPETNEF